MEDIGDIKGDIGRYWRIQEILEDIGDIGECRRYWRITENIGDLERHMKGNKLLKSKMKILKIIGRTIEDNGKM